MLTAIEAVEAVEVYLLDEAKSRIPDSLKDTHPYSHYALWQYYELGDPESECQWCKQYGNKVFTGDTLRSMFPDHTFDGIDILPNVHMTLWGKDTCKCRLIRLNPDSVEPEDVVSYVGDKVPTWTPDGYVTKK